MRETYPRVLSVGDGAVSVELGASLDEQTVGQVRALDDRLKEKAFPGILESVPTYASLLVLYDRPRLAFSELSETLLDLAQGLPNATAPGRLVEIPALYDGEDLDEVAQGCGLTKEAVVELHSGREYEALMLGFSPGFAYLGFVDERLRRPRLKTPRTRVPPGAIGIAGPQTGIYPRALPGGWNLLGRTSVRLFDSLASPGDSPGARGPSLLMPGDRVRFVPTLSLEPTQGAPKTEYRGSGVQVLEPGLLTTIQDGGRKGLRRVAVPLTGFADAGAARVANLCVGNPCDAPAIEICGPGLTLLFEKTTFVAIAGASVTADLERLDLDPGPMPMPLNVAVRARASNILTIRGVENGVRAYVAIAGMNAPRILGSASADLGSGFLRPLEAGDRLSVEAVDADLVRREPMAVVPRNTVVRVILGPQSDHFDARTLGTFLSAPWLVGLDSDRVGARLDGPRLPHSGPAEIVSDGMVPGCVQVPPDGRPIVMLSDCPTTGGYPKIACVVSADLGLIAQATPGRTALHFVSVRIEDL
jgi:KipI family sensor histidine kinase inhibitor